MITAFLLAGLFALFWVAVYVNYQFIAIREMIDNAFYSGIGEPDSDHPAWLYDDESWPA